LALLDIELHHFRDKVFTFDATILIKLFIVIRLRYISGFLAVALPVHNRVVYGIRDGVEM
jgi:hypothetical protein